MIYRAFAVLDNAVNSYGVPFFVNHQQHALRYFETLAKDPKSDVSRFPSQFHLFELGEYDDETGVFSSHASPVSFGLASSFLE